MVNYFYITYCNCVDYIYSIVKTCKFVGACDECQKYLYANDIFYQMKNIPNCSLRLQYCSEKCIQSSRSKFDYLKNIEFSNIIDEESRQPISLQLFRDTIIFTHKYPWTVNENPPALWNHIQTLKNLYQKSPKDCNLKTIEFLEDVKKYNIVL